MYLDIKPTPLIEISGLNDSISVFAKLESVNITGSIKDRIAYYMLKRAIDDGALKEGMTVIEPSSGNTAVSMAYSAKLLNLKFIAVVPPSTSRAKIKMIERYGGELIFAGNGKNSISPDDIRITMETAKKLQDEINGYIPNQFANQNNIKAHYLTTGREIWNDMEGRIDAFVAGFGTGGTIMGVGTYLLERDSNIQIVAVEPENSAILGGGRAGSHRIYGIGDGFVPPLLDPTIISWIETVSDDEAYKTAEQLLLSAGLFVGPSSGANIFASLNVAKLLKEKARVVTVLPDSGARYINTIKARDEIYDMNLIIR
ncbi:MAG: PLP-dependent cysteine synthase family protein [bacterium]